MIVDLHAHTYCSDGSLSPDDLLALAASQHVEMFSITDHDTTSAYDKVVSENFNFQLVTGVEVSCHIEGTELHVVGLGIDRHNETLQALLERNQTCRRDRAAWIVERLQYLGYDDISEALKKEVKGDVICRTHLANALVSVGLVTDFGKAFKTFLGRQGKVWRRAEWPALEEVIDVIHQAGGVAILAHPTKYRFSSGRLSKIVAEFASLNGDAIEINYSGLNLNHKAWLKRLALEHKLSVSVGCDFHHPGQTWALPGKFSRINDELTPVWQQLTR